MRIFQGFSKSLLQRPCTVIYKSVLGIARSHQVEITERNRIFTKWPRTLHRPEFTFTNADDVTIMAAALDEKREVMQISIPETLPLGTADLQGAEV